MKKLLSMAIIGFSFLLSACSDNSKTQDDAGRNPISILYPDGAEAVAITYLGKVALEEQGYNVSATYLDLGPLYAGISRGDADLFLDSWLPNTQRDYWARFGDNIDLLGTVFDDARIGLVVPQYMKIDSIDELNANKDLLDNKIYTIGAGAGINTTTTLAIDAYDLDYEQVTSSEASMIAALERALKNEDPIVITGWQPHFMWARHDLKFLDDPKNIYKIDHMEVAARKGFKEEYPEVAQFFSKFSFERERLNELIELVGKDNRNPEKGAKAFYDKYRTEIDAWFSN